MEELFPQDLYLGQLATRLGTLINRAPIANSGPDQKVNRGAPVAFCGSASSDPDGDPLTYGWDLVTI